MPYELFRSSIKIPIFRQQTAGILFGTLKAGPQVRFNTKLGANLMQLGN